VDDDLAVDPTHEVDPEADNPTYSLYFRSITEITPKSNAQTALRKTPSIGPDFKFLLIYQFDINFFSFENI